MGHTHYGLAGATLVTPTELLPNADVTVSGRHIAGLERPATGQIVDLRDHLVFPGLINAHDHLFGTWWPRVGPNRPYINVYEWLADYEKSPVLLDRGQNPVEDMYEIGAYRNLISGVTTVADHYKRIDGSEFYTRHPIHVLYEYGRTWTPRETTAWGEDIPTEYQRAVRKGQPYIIHLAEGLDQAAAEEMDVLTEANAVGRNTMVIHGIALRPDDMALMAEVRASVCWCPGSNLFLYGQTADIPALLQVGVNVALGTDSSLTGGLNLLDEVRIARHAYRDRTGMDPSLSWLIELVTTRAAYALMQEDRRGRIAPGYEADLLVLPDSHRDPYTALIEAQVSDPILLIRAGVPVYGDPEYRSLFERFGPGYTLVLVEGKEKLVAGDLVSLLDRLAQATGKTIRFPFLPVAAPDHEDSPR